MKPKITVPAVLGMALAVATAWGVSDADLAGHTLPGGTYRWTLATRPYRVYLPLVVRMN